MGTLSPNNTLVCYCISRTLIGNGQYVTNVTPLKLSTVNENFDVTNDVTVKSLNFVKIAISNMLRPDASLLKIIRDLKATKSKFYSNS